MNIGMLWYDNDPSTTLEAKITQAAAYYRQKYGAQPNVCIVHPNMQGEAPAGIELRHNSQVLRHHLYIGREHNAVTPE